MLPAAVSFGLFWYRAIGWCIDFFIDGWFAFVHILGLYRRCMQCHGLTWFNRTPNSTFQKFYDGTGNSDWTNTVSYGTKNCDEFSTDQLDEGGCSTYLYLFFICLFFMVLTMIVYTAACIYLVSRSKSECFVDLRNKIHESKKHKFLFWTFVLTGSAPVYFIYYDVIDEWRLYKEGEGKDLSFWERCKRPYVCWIDAHLFTLTLLQTMLEDIPLFIVQTYLSFTHYDDFIKGSVFFYFVYIFGVTLIITDFSDWIVIITTQDRTAKEEWSLWTWNSLYVLTGALTLVPVMGSVICVLDPEAGDELFLPKLILKIYVGAWIGRLIMAAFVAHFKTFKAWMFFVRHDKEYGNIEDKLATRKALRILKPKTEYFNPKGYAKRKDEWVKMESTFVEEDTRMEDNIANFGRNESVVEITDGKEVPLTTDLKLFFEDWGEYLSAYLQNLFYCLTGIILYSTSPFAGSKARTMLNTFLFFFQYVGIYVCLLVLFQGKDGTQFQIVLEDLVEQMQFFYEDVKVETSVARNKSFIAKFNLYGTIFASIMIISVTYLTYVTWTWYKDPKKSNFLVNDIDYMSRQTRGKEGREKAAEEQERLKQEEQQEKLANNPLLAATRTKWGLAARKIDSKIVSRNPDQVKLYKFTQKMRQNKNKKIRTRVQQIN